MDTMVEHINSAGRIFVEFALPMLIQSSVLIAILLLVDLLLRKKVKAVFRYWIWMLVLLKLILPTSLSSPLSLGYLFGDKLTYQDLAQTSAILELTEPAPADISPGMDPLFIQPNPYIPPTEPVTSVFEPVIAEPVSPPQVPVTPLSWQGVVFLVWLAVAIAMGLLLLQRALFVRGLVAQAKKAGCLMNDALAYCCASMGIKSKVGLKVSVNATTPSVCGLIRPVILVPWKLTSTLGASRLRTILMHELAHIRRGDLWVNLAQTALQIIYFYNPLFWFANSVIRRIREQAVDEAVLVAMGEKARKYPQTLVDVAKMTFKRPALSLRLIGVVESKSALAGRIKHILGRPMPKTAKLGIIGLLAVIIAGAILLPMARAQRLEFAGQGGPLDIRLAGVQPDGSDDVYDGSGNKIAENTFANIANEWGEGQQHRTFIFELPKTDEPILFSPFLKIKPVGAKRDFGTGQHPLLYDSAGKLTYSVGVSFPRTYKKVIKRRVRQVDLTLSYYYGQRGAADFVFTGPFTVGKTVKADREADCELTATKDRLEVSNDPAALFRISSKTLFDSDSVLVYDTSGRRYLPESGGGRRGNYGTSRHLRVEGLALNSIAYVTVGEKPYEAVFKNVVVSYPDRPVPERLEFLDEMYKRLDLTGFSGDLLNNYNFENPADAIKVIDIVRGRWYVMKVFRAIRYSDSGTELSNLDMQAQQKVRSAAAGWAKAGHPEVREMGIRLGLVGGWPEFMDMALEWLEQDVIVYDMLGRTYRGLEEGAKEQIAGEVASYPIALNSEQAERLKKIILSTDSPRLGMRLFRLFWRADEDLIFQICWDLVQDDRPWIWWPAMYSLFNRCNKKLRPFENLPEKIQKRLILVHKARGGSSRLFDVSSSGKDYDTVAKEAYAMLPAMFTARLARMNGRTCHDVRQVMAKHLDREIATKAMTDFLREISTESNQRLWVGDSYYFGTCCSTSYYIARHINSLYDVNIENLGKYETRENYGDIPRNISRLKQLIARTLQWYDDRSGENNDTGIAREIGAGNETGQSLLSATLPNDVTVELVGLCEHPSEGKQWWKPDGTLWEDRPYEEFSSHHSMSGEKGYELVWRLRADEDVVYEVESPDQGGSGGPAVLHNERGLRPALRNGEFYGVTLFFSPRLSQAAIEIGVGLDRNWKTIASLEGDVSKAQSSINNVHLYPAVGADDRTYIDAAYRFPEGKRQAYRIVAVDTSNKQHIMRQGSETKSRGGIHCRKQIDLPLKQIKMIHFQTQPLQRVTFKNVSLRPGVKTDMRVEAEDSIEVEETQERSFIKAVYNKATLQSSVTVELSGLTYIPAEDQPWWKPDGSPMESLFDRADYGPGKDPDKDQYNYYAASVRIDGLPPEEVFSPKMKWHADVAERTDNISIFKGDENLRGRNLYAAAIKRVSKDARSTDLQLGLAVGDWETIAKGRNMGFYEIGDETVILREPSKGFGGIRPWDKGWPLGVTYTITDQDFRIVILDEDGQLHPGKRRAGGGTKNLRRMEVTFPDIEPKQEKFFLIQTRPYEWIEFKNVALRPGHKTDSEVEDKASLPGYEVYGAVVDVVPDSWLEDYFARLDGAKSKKEFDSILESLSLEPQPAVGVTVKLQSRSRSKTITREAVTDEHGKYRFTSLPRAWYGISCEKAVTETRTGQNRMAFAKGGRYRQGIAVPRRQCINLHLRDDYVTVKGRIADANGHPFAGVQVRGITAPVKNDGIGETDEHTAAIRPQIISARSDDDGFYKLTGFKPANLVAIMGYLANGSPGYELGHKFYVDVTVGANDNTLKRIPLVTEESLYRVRRVFNAYRMLMQRTGGEEVQEKQDLPYPFASSHGNTITGIDIILGQHVSKEQLVRSTDTSRSYDLTRASDFVRKHFDGWKTEVRNNYLLKDHRIKEEYVLKGKTGAVAYVWFATTLENVQTKETKPFEAVYFLYRWHTDQWEGIYNTDGTNSRETQEAMEAYRNKWLPSYLRRVEQGYTRGGGGKRRTPPVQEEEKVSLRPGQKTDVLLEKSGSASLDVTVSLTVRGKEINNAGPRLRLLRPDQNRKEVRRIEHSEDNEFSFSGLAAGKYMIEVYFWDSYPTHYQTVQLSDTEHRKLSIQVKTNQLARFPVRGKVLNKLTGKGIEGAWIHFVGATDDDAYTYKDGSFSTIADRARFHQCLLMLDADKSQRRRRIDKPVTIDIGHRISEELARNLAIHIDPEYTKSHPRLKLRDENGDGIFCDIVNCTICDSKKNDSLRQERKADVPVEVEGTGEENQLVWGKAVQGVQVAAWVERMKWHIEGDMPRIEEIEKWRIGGDVPRVNVEVRISDPRKFEESGLAAKFMAHDWSAFALEIDGKQYKQNVFFTTEPGPLRSPFKIVLSLDDEWQGGLYGQPWLSPGRHKIRVLFVGLGMKVASEPVEIEILPDDKKLESWPHPWGKAVRGVQVSAHPAQPSWPVGSEPVIRVCLRNQGKEKWSIHERPSSFALEVDGKRYENNFIFNVWRRPFAPGDVYQFDLKLSKSKPFHDGLRKGNSWPPVGKPPPLLLGKHTIRVLFTELRIEPEPASQPVEFEIVPAGKPDVRAKIESPGDRAALMWGEPVNGLRAAVRLVPEKSSYSPGEQIGVRFCVENVSERTIKIARIEGQTDPGNWIIEDPNQTRISVGGMRWMGARRLDRRVLKPGQTAVLELEPLTIVESRTSRKGRVQAVVNGPGTYTARYRLNLTPRAEGDWSGALETAKRKFVVTTASRPDQKTAVPVEVDDANSGIEALHITSHNDGLRIEYSDAQSVIVLENGKVSTVSSNGDNKFQVQTTRLKFKLNSVTIELDGQRNRVHVSGLDCSAEITPQNGLIEVKWTDGNQTNIQKGESLKILLPDFQITVYDKAGRRQSLLKPRQRKGLISGEAVRTDVPVGTEKPVVGEWEDVGNPIPADFNDTMALTEQITLRSIGQDAEEKTFITFVWDKEKNRNRQYRFVLIKNNDTILEPDSHLILDENGRLEEKFTFDEPYVSWRLKEFKLQSRPPPLAGNRSISSQLQKGTSTAFEGKTISPSRLAPPGRYAIELDGVDDYLLVPDSPTLRLDPPFTVEMWIKPRLPEQKIDRLQEWGVIAQGCYIGTGRVKPRGFGIELTRFEKEPAKFNISYCEASDSGITGSDIGSYSFDEWMHISHVFEGGNYEPGHGHPLVVGKFVIPVPEPFMGQIGEVRIWNTARTRQEIRRYKDVALTGKEPGLAACWTFEQNEGQFAYDISGNNNHGRLGKAVEPDDADPKWVDLEAASRKPDRIADVQGEAEREKDTSPGKRIEFFGLDLTDARRISKFADLPDLFEERPTGSKSYEIAKSVTVMYGGFEGTLYYIPEKEVFYIQQDKLGSSTRTFYGPFNGNPHEVLDRQIDVSIKAEEAEASSGESESAANEDGPRITFESLVCDLGRIPPNTKHVCEFKYTNTGSEVLRITRVSVGCACTVPQKTRECAPGESGTLKVTYQSAARAGPVKKYVFVNCNDKVNPRIKLAIKAEIVIKVAHEPERLSLVLDKKNAGCPAITLTSLDNQPFSITGFKSTGDSITADFDSSAKETSFVLKPKVDMEKFRKGLRGTIEIGLTHPECKKIAILFDTLSEFKTDPRVIYVRDAQPLKTVTKKVSVLSNYNEDVEIESTSSKKDIIKVLTQEKVRNGYQFELQITPPAVESKRRVFTDVFTVRLKGGQQLQITCYGIYPKKPAKTTEKSTSKTDVQVEARISESKAEKYEGKTIDEWISRWDSELYDDIREATEALTRIGRPAVPAMIEQIKKRSNHGWRAVGVLSKMGPQAEDALELLIEMALDKDLRFGDGRQVPTAYRGSVLYSLSDMKWARQRVIPVLQKIAEDGEEDPGVRQSVIWLLRRIGKGAMPILQKLTEAEERGVRDAAHGAIGQLLEKEEGLSKDDYFTPLIEKDPFGPSVLQYMENTRGMVNYGRPHPLTQRVKKLYRQRLAKQPDSELAWRLATIIQNGLKNTELMWAAPAEGSKGRSPREDPTENYTTLAEVLQLGFDHAESGSQLQRQFGTSLAKLRLLQGDWNRMNAMLQKLGQKPIPKESRQLLHAPPVDWEGDLRSQWKIADESMRSGNCSLEFKIEKAGKGLKGVHILVKRAPEPTNGLYTGISTDTLFFAPTPMKVTFGSFGYEAKDRPMTRYAVSDESGIVRFEKLPNIPVKIEVLVPTSNFPEAVSNWDLWMEVEPGKFKIAKKYGGAEAVGRGKPPAVEELREGETVHYPKLVVRPAFGLNVRDWIRVDKDNFVLSWAPMDSTTQAKTARCELEMFLSAPPGSSDRVTHAPVLQSAKIIVEGNRWPVGEKGVGKLRLEPGNIYVFEIRALDTSGVVIARWPRTRVWTPWDHRTSDPPYASVPLRVRGDVSNRPPIHNRVWHYGSFDKGTRRRDGLREEVARFLSDSTNTFEYEYVRMGKAWLDWHDDRQSARQQLEQLVKELPEGNVARGTAIWLIQQIDENKDPPKRLNFVPDPETSRSKAVSLPDEKADAQLEVEQSGRGSKPGDGRIVVVSKGKSTMYSSIQEAVDATTDGSVIRVSAGVYGERPEVEVEQSERGSKPGDGRIIVVSKGKSTMYSSIQEAIDAAPAGSVIRIGPGVYKERLEIDKPLTLEGAGWDQTTIVTENNAADVFEEAMSTARERVHEAKSEEEAKRLSAEFQAQFEAEMKEKMAPQTHLVSDTENVVIRNLKLTSPGRRIEGRALSVPVLKFSNARALVSGCAVVGTPGNGINIEEGSNVEVRDSLVAGVWSTGIAVTSGNGDIANARIINCDVRNCYHRGITIGPGCDSTVVQGCRISGSSWHGIRYDNASPRVIGNLIFANVRCGIYASGETAATVRQNLFYGNEMTGIACWYKNRDTIEANTFVGNKRSGLEVLGASRPIVQNNIFYANPAGVFCGNIGDDSTSATSDGTVNLKENLFWGFEHKVAWRHPGDAEDEVVTEEVELDEKTGNVAFDPEFKDITEEDYSLKMDSPALRSGIGAAVLIDSKSPWPIQDEEIPIIPDGEMEDTSWMGRISSTGKIQRPVIPVANQGGKKPQEPIKAKPRQQEGSEHPGRISGVVINSDTGDPIVGAYVGVGDFGDSGGSNYSRHRSQGFHDKTKTDAEGRFELGGLVFTDKHRDLQYHPLVVTHPDFVRHDRKIELPSDGPAPEVKVNLMPAAKIEVTIVDADGNPLEGQWLIRLEALDGRRFIPPGSDPHLSSFASSIWAQMPDLRAKMGVSNGFTFTELDAGEYSIEAIRFHLVDKPTPQNIWKPILTYHGSIPNIRIQTGQAQQVRLTPQDHQTRLNITPPEFPDKLMDKLERSSQMPLMCLISRSPGLLLWGDGKIYHLEDQRLGRISKRHFFRGFFPQGKPLTINNLPPDSYSLFAMAVYGQVAGCLIGARADLARGDNVTLDMPWRQPTGPSTVGPNRSFDYPVKLEARDYSASELCEILTEITQSNPRIIADPSIENEKLRFGKGQMSVWDVLEKLYLDKGWRVGEVPQKALILETEASSTAKKRRVYLPDLETPHANVILDLATGEMLQAMWLKENKVAKLGKGDVVYEYSGNHSSLLCLRGATMQLRTNVGLSSLKVDSQREYFAGYLLKEVPCQYQVTTAEGDKYELKVISIDKGDTGGAFIQFWKSEKQQTDAHKVGPGKLSTVTDLPSRQITESFHIPPGLTNVALNKPVSSSDHEPILGEIEMITDGDKTESAGSYVELHPSLQYVTIDLEVVRQIHAISVWHYQQNARVYSDVVVQVTDDPDFTTKVRTVFNNDIDNSAGLGFGRDQHYVETNKGKLIDCNGVEARYVRLYSRGNTSDNLNHYVEVEVYAKSAGRDI